MDQLAPKPRRRLRKGMYILPSLFTTANMGLGYYAILEVIHASATEYAHLDNAAKAIGFAVLFDGLDGRIARMTGTTSDFGRELDSLADAVAFGVAPALLAWVWGFHLMPPVLLTDWHNNWHIKLTQLGAIACFLFLIAGVSRLARFNITSNPQPSNPGRPGKKYFVGMPIPAAAGTIAAIVHWEKTPLEHWGYSLGWMAVVALLAFLMVSRMRYYSFKTLDLRKRRSYLAIIFLGLIIWAIWLYSEPVLLTMAVTYALSGIILRITSKFRPHPPAPEEVHAA